MFCQKHKKMFIIKYLKNINVGFKPMHMLCIGISTLIHLLLIQQEWKGESNYILFEYRQKYYFNSVFILFLIYRYLIMLIFYTKNFNVKYMKG